MTGANQKRREATRTYIQAAAAALGVDNTGLARKSGVSPSTINRFMNGDTTHIPGMNTLTKVVDASGLPLPPELTGHAVPGRPPPKSSGIASDAESSLGAALAQYIQDQEWEQAISLAELLLIAMRKRAAAQKGQGVGPDDEVDILKRP